MKPSRKIETLLEIMKALRDKESGCPWDIKQNFKSIVPYTIEEAYEVADAIEREDHDELCEELGDLLLQVVFHSQMASEAELFDFGNVVEGITRKLIRRHPHVFGSENATESSEVKHIWESIKQQEREEKKLRRLEQGIEEEVSGLLDEVPSNHPALTVALKIQKKAAQVGFDWTDAVGVLEKVHEEISELEEVSKFESDSSNHSKIEEEIGDVLFSLVNLARHLGVNPEIALRRTNSKFTKRFKEIESVARKDGINLDEMELVQMEEAWDNAKKNEKK